MKIGIVINNNQKMSYTSVLISVVSPLTSTYGSGESEEICNGAEWFCGTATWHSVQLLIHKAC